MIKTVSNNVKVRENGERWLKQSINYVLQDILMHFAQMLRTEKLARKENGLFEITNEIGYQVMPKAR